MPSPLEKIGRTLVWPTAIGFCGLPKFYLRACQFVCIQEGFLVNNSLHHTYS